MMEIRRAAVFAATLVAATAFSQPEARIVECPAATAYRAPLHGGRLTKLPVGKVQPKGWLREVLIRQSNGLNGQLGTVSAWLDKQDNQWLSDSGDHGWEEVPYWLRGYSSLAYILDDEQMKQEAQVWFDAVLTHQKASGELGPSGTDGDPDTPDLWAKMPMLWALQTYYEHSGDQRVLTAMTSYFKWQLTIADDHFLKGLWQSKRGGDNEWSVVWLYNHTGDRSILPLIGKLHRCGVNWTMTDDLPDWHGVNVAQGFREPATYYIYTGEEAMLRCAYNNHQEMRKRYGQVPGGMYGADENARQGCGDPRQGAETCAVVEQMASDEIMMGITGDAAWADHLEEVAFNTLPAALTADMRALRYITAPNMAISDGKNHAPSIDNSLRGMLSMSPFSSRCCQHNHGMGWPYLAEHLVMNTADGGLATMVYLASQTTAEVAGGKTVTIDIDTNYPFEEQVCMTIHATEPTAFPLYLRIPRWAEEASLTLNGNAVALGATKPAGNYVRLNGTWNDGDELRLVLPMSVGMRTWKQNKGSLTVDYGPLTLSLQIGERYVRRDSSDPAIVQDDSHWQATVDKSLWPAYEIVAKSAWNYALETDGEGLPAGLSMERRPWPADNYPFTQESVPLVFTAKARRVPSWGFDQTGMTAELPSRYEPRSAETEEIRLVPMGAARLRITAFPPADVDTADDEQKSIVTLADPYILLDDGTYYAYGTGEADGIAVWTSDDLLRWTRHDQLALHRQNTTETQWFWAPEVYRKNGKYYMYYSANEHLYVATADKPTGPFRQVGDCMTKAMLGDEKCIDSSVFFDDDGTAWLFFVRFTDGNCIWMCQLEDDLMTLKAATLSKCINVSQAWEDKLGRVNEGPFVLKQGGIYYLTYSANDFRSHDYAVGYAMTRSLTPANGTAPSWSKYGGNPIVHRVEDLFGTGHHSLFTDKEGRLRIVFHAHDSETEVYPRRMYIGTMEFVGNKLQMTADPVIRPVEATHTPETPDDPETPSVTVDPSWQLEYMPGSTVSDGVTAWRDLKYNRLFTRTLGWNGGDGVLTVGLPNGDVLWTFNDSFYGVVNAEDRSRGDCNFPRNSIMVQRAHDGVLGETDNDLIWLADYVNCRRPAAGHYYHARTHLRHPLGNKTQAQINAGEIDEDKVYWSGDGVVCDGKLQMVWIAVESKELRNLGTALATYSLDGTVPTGRYVDTIPDYLPKAGDYLFRESVTHDVNDNVVSYGSTICDEAADGHLYLYGVDGFNVLVARTATESLYSPWQYYVKKSDGQWVWQDDYPGADDMKRSNIMASAEYACHLPWVFRQGDWYYLTSQAPIFSTEVYIYRSRTPYGPFTDKRLLFRLPDHLDKIGPQKYHWLYMVNLHPALSRSGELVFSTNSDPDDFWWNFNDPGSADYYRPYFYRVFDWQKVYDDITEPQVESISDPSSDARYPATSVQCGTAWPSPLYSLLGVRTARPQRGVYIRGGRKIANHYHYNNKHNL